MLNLIIQAKFKSNIIIACLFLNFLNLSFNKKFLYHQFKNFFKFLFFLDNFSIA